MANNFVHGKLGTVTLNSTDFPTLQYDFEEFGDLEDITFTVAGGATWRRVLPGYPGARGTLTFVYDTLNQPTISPFDMRFGTLMIVNLKPEGTKPYAFNAYSGNFKFTSGPQAGAVKCTTSFESDGQVTFPTS